MEQQVINELRRISNRIQMLCAIFEIYLVKEYSQDPEVMKAIQVLRERQDNAEKV